MNPQVVLLCGGKSSRMWPLSDKIFFEYLGKTVLEHQIESLVEAGFSKKIHIVANDDNVERVRDVVSLAFSEQKNIFSFSVQKDFEAGMLSGILSAEKDLDPSQSVLIMSSNDFVEKSFFQKLSEQAQNSDSSLFLCGKKVEKYFPGGYLVLESGKYIQAIAEKPGEGNEPSDMVNLVFHLFTNASVLFDRLQKYKGKSSKNQDQYEQCLQDLFDSGEKAEVVVYEGFWQALKYPWDHLHLTNFFLDSISGQEIHPSVTLPKNVSVSGNVIIEEGVKMFDFAVVNGPVYIGKDSIIGNHSLIRSAHIGQDCLVGYSSEVARSYLRKNIRLHQNYVGDSVLDENISFGAGTRTGNLRLDEKYIFVKVKEEKVCTSLSKFGLICGKNVRAGINTSFMPGVKIGKNSFVGAGIAISKDIEEGVFVTGDTTLTLKENTYYAHDV